MLTTSFHGADGTLLAMRSDSSSAIMDVLNAGKASASEACQLVPRGVRNASGSGAGSVQESIAAAANICQRQVRGPNPTFQYGFGATYPMYGWGEDAAVPPADASGTGVQVTPTGPSADAAAAAAAATCPACPMPPVAKPFYKDWKFWAGAGGAAAVGIGVGVLIGHAGR